MGDSRFKEELLPYENKSEYMTFHDDEHPFHKWDDVCNTYTESDMLEVFMDREWFATSAMKWIHFSPDLEDIARKVVDTLLVFAYIVTRARVDINTPAEDKNKKPRRSGSVSSSMSSDDAADAAREVEEKEEDSRRKQKEDVDKRRGVLSFMEVVPSVDNPDKVVGYRKKIVINAKDRVGCRPAHILHALLSKNESDYAKQKIINNPYKRKDHRPSRIHSILFSDWIAICSWYSHTPLQRSKFLHWDEMLKPDSPINPLKVFSQARSFEYARRKKAHPEYWMPTRYKVDGNMYSSPHGGRHMYWLSPWHDDLEKIFVYIWPNIHKPQDDDHQRDLFLRGAADEAYGSDEEQPNDNMDKVYNLFARNNASTAMVSNVHQLHMKSRKRREELQYEVEKIEDSEQREKAWVDGIGTVSQTALDEFKSIFSRNGNAPKSIKAIAAFMDRHFQKGAKLPWKKKLKDLSRFGELMASLVAGSESLQKVNTLHTDVVGGFLKAIHVYTCKPFHCHTLVSGPPKVGKTFTHDVLGDCLIEGTYSKYAYTSAKADAVNGNDRDCYILFYEEAPPTMLGVNKNAGGKAAATNQTDQENFTKVQLTSGTFNAKRQTVNDEGKRILEDVEVKCNAVWFLATNEQAASIPDAMLSRFHVRNLQTTNRSDGGGLIGRYSLLFAICCLRNDTRIV